MCLLRRIKRKLGGEKVEGVGVMEDDGKHNTSYSVSLISFGVAK